MAETSGPFDAGSLSEANWELMTEQLIDGWLSGLTASVSATTRGVDITSGTALCRGHWYRNSATLTKTSSSNGAGSDRIDRAVLRLDRSGDTVTIAVLTGTAGSATPPALTDNATVTERPLYRWTVAPGATAVTGITSELQGLGRGVKKCTSTNRPYAPVTGDVAYESDTSKWIGYNGSSWVTLREDTGDVPFALASGWTADGSVAGRRLNGVVDIEVNARRTGAGLAETDQPLLCTLPAELRPTTRTRWLNAHLTGDNFCRADIGTDGTIYLRHFLTAMATGEYLRMTATYIA